MGLSESEIIMWDLITCKDSLWLKSYLISILPTLLHEGNEYSDFQLPKL